MGTVLLTAVTTAAEGEEEEEEESAAAGNNANDSHRGGETSGGGGERLARDNASAAGLPRGEVGQVVEGNSRPWYNTKASGGPRHKDAVGFFPNP